MHIISRAAIIAAALCSATLNAETLTLESAIARAYASAPEFQANTARLDALRAARTQAGVRPNPVVEVLGENVTGTGPYKFLGGAEITATYAQTIERGGKRQARVALVEGDISLAEAEALVQRLEIAQRVQTAYNEAVTAQALIEVVENRLQLAKSLQSEVNRRVREARDPLFAGTRAATRVEEAEVDLELAKHARDAALTRLAMLWGGTPDGLDLSTEQFFKLEPVEAASPSSVDLGVYEARARRAEAAIRLEQTRRTQDPTVRGGVRYLNQTGDLAVLGGVSIPLARNDTNRANVERAIAERRRAEADIEVARFTRLRELRLAEEKVNEARHEAEALLTRVFPGALKTLEQVRAGFARGGFRHVDIDEAQTRLGAVRERIVRAVAEYHTARVELDRLSGRFATLASREDVR